jgi:3-phenylpropionate/trans-cinnamate dioxygenase ferredoxin reductase subunit
LSANDVVYTSGAPAMTEAVARIARTAGARCYTDPFVSSAQPAGQPTMARRFTGWLNNPQSARPIVRPARKPPGGHRPAFSNVR